MLAMRECHLDIFSFEMDDGIANFFRGGFTREQVKQTIFGMEGLSVVFNF